MADGQIRLARGRSDEDAAATSSPEPVSAAGDASAARRRRLLLIGAGLGALLLLLAYHGWWLLRMRDGYPVDVDEAGYITIALNDLAGWRAGGLSGLWDAFQQQPPQAPLTPLLAVPVLAVHRAIMTVFAVELLALAVVVLATFGITRRLAGARWGVVAAVAVAAMPGIVNYTREFSFALPCAATITVAGWALIRSDHATRTRWMVLWGVAGGLAVLARTMAIGFLPGIIAAGVVLAAGAPAGMRRRAALNVVAGFAAGVLVAGTWYLRNYQSVLDYLTGYGYGEKSGEYGTQPALLSSDWLLTEIRLVLIQLMFLPLFAMLVVVLVVALPVGLRSAQRGGWRASALRVLRSPALALTLIPLEGYLALSTTENNGSAFALPLLPIAVALIVAAAAQLPRLLSYAAAVGLVAVSLFQIVSFAQVGLFDGIHVEDLPVLQTAVVTDPRPPALQAVGQVPGALRFGEADRGWLDAAHELVDDVLVQSSNSGRYPIIAFATRDRLLNTNMVQLAAQLYANTTLPMAQLDPTWDGDTVAAYRDFLSDPMRGQPNVLVTSSDERNDFNPNVTQRNAITAARQLGFRPFGIVLQPNGELSQLWWLQRGAAPPSAPAPASP